MKQIEPVSLWVNGQLKEATFIDLRIVNDNLKDTAVFYYSLVSEISQSLAQGNLTISGQDYIDWGLDTNVNQWAYNWAATQLNLVLVPEV